GNSATAAPSSARRRLPRRLRSLRAPAPRCRAAAFTRGSRGVAPLVCMVLGSEAAAEERRHRVLEDLHDLIRGDGPEGHDDPRGHEREIGRATSELQSRFDLVCRLLLEKKKSKN